MILQQLREYAAGPAHDRTVADVRIGLCYTAVLLDDGSAGVAYTFKEYLPPGCDVFQGKRPVAGKTASETLAYLASPDLLERAVGLATANALINHSREELSREIFLTCWPAARMTGWAWSAISRRSCRC